MARVVFPLCYLTWDQSMEEVMKIMPTSFKRSHACTAALSAPNPVAGHCLSTPLPETPEHSQASLGQSLVGSLLLYPGSWCIQGFVCAPQESFFPVLCKFWWLCGRINATSFKRAYAIPKSTAPRTSAPRAVHYRPIPHRRHSNNFCLSLFGVSGPWGAQGLFEPSEHLCWVWGFILNMILPLLPPSRVFLLPLDVGVSPQSHSNTTQPRLQCQPSCWGFSILGRGISPQSQNKTQFPLQSVSPIRKLLEG